MSGTLEFEESVFCDPSKIKRHRKQQ